MKAVQLAKPGGLDCLKLVDLPEPAAPAAGEILVRLHASSLNFHDYAVVAGFIPAEDGRIPMADGAGVVEAVGDGVSEFAVGDHVVSCFFTNWPNGAAMIGDFKTTPGDGVDGYARERVTMPATHFTHAPSGYSHAEAATLTTAGLTAWRALVVNGGIKAGDSVLVLGTGGVSIFALQMARVMGATVIATSSSDAKLERVKKLGAAHTINYKTTAEWGKRVLELTDGRGVDHVIEVGGPGTLPQSIRACRIGGHIALIGVLTGRGGEIPTALLMAKQQRLQGIVVGSRQHQIDMLRALEAVELKPVIDKTFALADLADAFRYEESGAHFGKICVQI
jgi:NADPH:quinone reductase-like Zn-dependent oxidoreductase